MIATCLNIDACDWFWCKTHKRCLLFVQSCPKNRKENIYFTRPSETKIPRSLRRKNVKEKKKNSKKLKTRLTPFKLENPVFLSIYKCHYCDRELTYNQVTVDHKVPKINKGSNHHTNLLPCCINCNQDKGSKPYEEYIKLISKS